jgi:hypothetical protein
LESKKKIMNNIPVVLEIGTKRTFASALEWPGWSRSGKTEAAAITALLEYAPRFARAMNAAGIPFRAPLELAAFEIIERLPGNATTDFGGLGAVPAYDLQPLEEIEFDRQLAILDACWLELDAASAAASEKNLRLGPRGGGRQLAEMLRHLADSQIAYFSQLGWKVQGISFASPAEKIAWLRAEIPLALSASARGELPSIGSRGGKRWSARNFVRHSAWHILDHSWEIEDRID